MMRYVCTPRRTNNPNESYTRGLRFHESSELMSIRLYLPETRFAVASIPLEQYGEVVACLGAVGDFVMLTRDKEEVTLIIAEDAWRELARRFPNAAVQEGRRLI